MKIDKREPAAPALLKAITERLGTFDSVSTADAVALGAMIHEYGQACAGDATYAVMAPMMDSIGKRLGIGEEEKKKPWE